MIYEVTDQPTLILKAGEGSALIINRDEEHSLIVTDPTGETEIIEALSSKFFNGAIDKYGKAEVPITVNVAHGVISWQPSPLQTFRRMNNALQRS